jgi:hypothetical protein
MDFLRIDQVVLIQICGYIPNLIHLFSSCKRIRDRIWSLKKRIKEKRRIVVEKKYGLLIYDGKITTKWIQPFQDCCYRKNIKTGVVSILIFENNVKHKVYNEVTYLRGKTIDFYSVNVNGKDVGFNPSLKFPLWYGSDYYLHFFYDRYFNLKMIRYKEDKTIFFFLNRNLINKIHFDNLTFFLINEVIVNVVHKRKKLTLREEERIIKDKCFLLKSVPYLQVNHKTLSFKSTFINKFIFPIRNEPLIVPV